MGGLILLRLLLIIAGTLDIISCQDNSQPKWIAESTVNLTRGIKEDTKIGTILCQLTCVDIDGDPIEYGLQSGSVVRVASDGTVFLNQPLDYEAKDAAGYDIAFWCRDYEIISVAGRNMTSFLHEDASILTVDISVDDANDIAPRFNTNSPTGYSYLIAEDAPIGTMLEPSIEIIDGDIAENAVIDKLYLICNSTNATELAGIPESSRLTCQKFELSYIFVKEGRYNATIALKSKVDFETRPVYSSEIVAIDKGDGKVSLSTTINIQINIGDAQDIDPLFTNIGATTSVFEGAAKGSPVRNFVILARDGDVGSSRPVRIDIIEDERDAFTLTQTLPTVTKGVYGARLTVNTSLDRETITGAYQFTVKVTELNETTGEDTTATATATYSVTVLDINDEAPEFEESTYLINVTEIPYSLEPVQITGLSVVCEDKDEPSNAQYRVSIVDQTFPGVFSISPDTKFIGRASMFLRVEKTDFADYDIPRYREQVVVMEAKETRNDNPRSSSTTVTIWLGDVNDNRPEFTEDSYSKDISEKEPVPTVLLTIKANDKDSGDNGEVEYEFEQGTSSEFSLNPVTGKLSLQKQLDYEDTNQYVLLVNAVDKGVNSRSNQVQVTINVLNYNDEAPVFRQPSYETTVNEDSLNFFTPVVVKATDTEEGTVRVTYRIVSGQSPNDAFVLNADTGKLTLQKPLRYQDTILDENNQPSGRFVLVVEATDNTSPDPPQTSTVLVTIFIIDQNNFSPVLDPQIYFQNLTEIVEPGAFVAKIVGTDKDLGTNGEITYRLDSGGFDNFVVDPVSGVVTVNDPQNFDYDERRSYEVLIKATDGGSPRKSDIATIYVDIFDSNNKPPKFKPNFYPGSVNEEEKINTIIFQVFASDPDSTKKLRYRILKDTMLARDGDGSELSSTSSYDFKNAFAINETSGEVYVNSDLDKDIAREINFEIEVEDIGSETGKQIDTAQVSMTVTGKIDDDIIFEVTGPSYMNENSPVTFDVVTLIASDPLNPQDNLDFYKLSESSPDFNVLLSGVVRPARVLNFEADPINYRIVVQAMTKDKSRSATASLTINLLDVNDNAPDFERKSYYGEVDEDSVFPTEVAFIRATDADSSSYGPVVYRISGGVGSEDFQLFENANGVSVLVAKGRTLNYNKRSVYLLDIIANDLPNRNIAGQQLFSTVELKIVVIDKNNNFPIFKFDEKSRSMAVAESAPKETSVGTTIATDADFGKNGDVSYRLLPIASEPDSYEGVQLFRIIESLGIIVVAESLLGRGDRTFPMRVMASDHGDQPKSNYLNIEITILSTEIDDGSPLWITPSRDLDLTIPEERAPIDITRSDYFRVQARTGDSVVFSLSPLTTYDGAFTIDTTTGQLRLTKRLDREEKESYILLVYAGDINNTETIRSSRQITVHLEDINDNDASFKNPKGYSQCGEPVKSIVEVPVQENTQANVQVYRVKACDPDGPGNNEILYEPFLESDYCAENYKSAGIVVQPDGRLTTNHTIDYEEDTEFILCVEAVSINPSNSRKRRAFDESKIELTLDNVIYIYIVVKDQNDNGPEFPEKSITAVMNIRPSGYETVVQLNAIDRDREPFNSIEYSITSVLYHESGQSERVDYLFGINRNSFVAPSRSYYERYIRGYFEMEVLAVDGEKPELYDTQHILIFVYRPFQAIKLVLNMSPIEGYEKSIPLERALNEASNNRYKFEFLRASEHSIGDDVDVTRTDVCFLVIDTSNNHVLERPDAIGAFGEPAYQSVLNMQEYKVQDIGACYLSKSSEDSVKWRKLWWVLVALAIFIFVCCLIFIVLVCILYRRYKRYMKSKKMYLVPQ